MAGRRRKSGRACAIVVLLCCAPAAWPEEEIAEGVAPRVRPLSASDTATATPTSEPWIDSNLWLVRSLTGHSRAPVWLHFRVDGGSGDDYARAIADTAAAGGRWAVELDDGFQADLRSGQSEALAKWGRIVNYLRFFEDHRGWREFVPSGPLGIVYDPAGKYVDISNEYLNLIARRRIPYRVIHRADLGAGALGGLKAVLAIDASPPRTGERALMESFAEAGGLVVTGPGWGKAPAGGEGYEVENSGKGRVAIYREDPPDPETVSRDMLTLIGRANTGIRLFNGPSVLCHVTTGEAGARLLVQLINYATLPAEAVSLRVDGEYKAARVLSPDAPPAELAVELAGGRTQVSLPAFSVYAAVVFEK
ncbi:MAG TPA: hypothetical protein VLE22_10675 [Bryobacteraceae bacterium]|nr:hypothetical protein [Bryobacteraceae bacterium]